ncbi:MAG: DUF1573 domain-containing protein [Pirellulaceae bacterium]|nr:DUF1573 domain-containing protein [Pirellulaceae bacterium]
MFESDSHDFRTVGRGAKAEHHFVLENKFQEDVRIASVRTSCGCTTPIVTKNLLKTHERGAIIAKFNTDTFIGQKAATITVVFDRPYYAEVQLKVKGFIRTDITFSPNEVAYGEVAPGQSITKNVVITRTGKPDWEITDVRSHCNHLQVSLDPAERLPGMVRYRMQVRIKDTMPEGDIRERLTLITNDRDFPTTEMSISGRIRPTLSISPATVSIGNAKHGQTVEKRLVVRGEQPFEIRKVVCADDRFDFDVPAGKKKLHFVKMRFNADEQDASVGQEVRIVTDLGEGKSATCIVTGAVGK